MYDVAICQASTGIALHEETFMAVSNIFSIAVGDICEVVDAIDLNNVPHMSAAVHAAGYADGFDTVGEG